jgi:adenylate cyclase
MADEQQKRQVFAGVWQFLLEARGDRPALIVLDDVHWADLSTLDLLGFLLERLAGIPLLLVLAYRPGFERVEQAALRASHTGIRLEPLSAAESVELAKGYLAVMELPPDLERIVATRAEGNPFFVEELLQALLELGSLAVVDGRAVLAKIEVDIPDTVQGTILARVDRLATGERTVLQHAAVLGRSFSTDLIEAVVGDGQSLNDALDELTRAQLIVAQGPDRWAFKHALIQEVTYETLLLRQRKELHRRIAEVLEARAGDDPASLEVLAEHYARAEAPEKARAYAVKAGDLASQRMGFVEAQGRYETALRLWGEGDEEGRLDLMMELAQAALLGGDEATARTSLVEAEARWRALGDIRKAGAALASLGRVYWVTGETDRGAEVLSRAVQLLEPEGPSPELVWAFVWTSSLNMLAGRVDVALPFATRGLAMAEELGMEGAQSHLLNNIGCCECFTADPSGLERIRRALDLAERSGEAEAIGRAYVNLPSTLREFSQNREAAALSRKGREVMRRLGSPAFEWFIAANEADSLSELGEYQEAEALCRESLEQRAMLGAPGVVNAGGVLAWMYSRLGRYDEARQLLDEVLPIARGIGGAEFLSRTLVAEAELEEGRRNFAAARQAVAEAARIVFETPSAVHWFLVLPTAARLLPKEVVSPLIEQARGRALHPSFEANLAEAEGYVTAERARFGKAADLYRSQELPYQEARCRLEAGDINRAREIIEQYGLGDGPLGARLRELEGSA